MSWRRERATQPDLRMNAYYYGFTSTGVREIDEMEHHETRQGDGLVARMALEAVVDD